MDLERKYKRLKDNIEDNFGYWLDNYIANDISEAGEVDYLITEIDEYYFCLQLEQELKWCIDDLINSDNKELLIKFVGLKRILNKKMINNKYYNDEDINEIYGIVNENITIHNYIKLNSTIEKIENVTELLHKELLKTGFIECTFKEFNLLFNDSKNHNKILWLGRQIDLLGLIFQLEKKSILSKDNLTKSKIAFRYFKSKKGIFNKRSLEVKSSDVVEEEYKYQLIIDIIDKLVESN